MTKLMGVQPSEVDRMSPRRMVAYIAWWNEREGSRAARP